eukprot:CAMPEP_0198530116 /NCGR_PEP_ID=MMETSP1462-20131121/26164_1 /TAXON_ID=1333877 /ORGANISM="Brandtodinium nutriculum, Strain RCC3387" /LENGTH=91 /DNA_ID=CAMNT_0044259985 /DNA_START=1093 /DNA_END=1368 /DNA_ORIENTATION=-
MGPVRSVRKSSHQVLGSDLVDFHAPACIKSTTKKLAPKAGIARRGNRRVKDRQHRHTIAQAWLSSLVSDCSGNAATNDDKTMKTDTAHLPL